MLMFIQMASSGICTQLIIIIKRDVRFHALAKTQERRNRICQDTLFVVQTTEPSLGSGT